MNADSTEVSVANTYCVVYRLAKQEWQVTGEGWAQVHLYKDRSDGTFRLVGWTVLDFEVVINCNVTGICRYKKKSVDFHKFTDDEDNVWGFGFYKREESLAESQAFMDAVLVAIDDQKQWLPQDVVVEQGATSPIVAAPHAFSFPSDGQVALPEKRKGSREQAGAGLPSTGKPQPAVQAVPISAPQAHPRTHSGGSGLQATRAGPARAGLHAAPVAKAGVASPPVDDSNSSSSSSKQPPRPPPTRGGKTTAGAHESEVTPVSSPVASPSNGTLQSSGQFPAARPAPGRAPALPGRAGSPEKRDVHSPAVVGVGRGRPPPPAGGAGVTGLASKFQTAAEASLGSPTSSAKVIVGVGGNVSQFAQKLASASIRPGGPPRPLATKPPLSQSASMGDLDGRVDTTEPTIVVEDESGNAGASPLATSSLVDGLGGGASGSSLLSSPTSMGVALPGIGISQSGQWPARDKTKARPPPPRRYSGSEPVLHSTATTISDQSEYERETSGGSASPPRKLVPAGGYSYTLPPSTTGASHPVPPGSKPGFNTSGPPQPPLTHGGRVAGAGRGPPSANLGAATMSMISSPSSMREINDPTQHQAESKTMDNIYQNRMVPLGKLPILPQKPGRSKNVIYDGGPTSSFNVTDPYSIIHTQHVKYDVNTRKYEGLPPEWEKHLSQQFGLPPDKVETIKLPEYEARIPTVLQQMKDYLFENGGLVVEGIFRIAPDQDECTYVKQLLNENKFSSCSDVNCMSNLIKVWFRELPSHILNPIRTNIDNVDDEPKALGVVELLPQPNRSLMQWLLDMCVMIVRNAAVNKMTPKNLAIVISPNLFTPDTGDPLKALQFSQRVARFVELAIQGRCDAAS